MHMARPHTWLRSRLTSNVLGVPDSGPAPLLQALSGVTRLRPSVWAPSSSVMVFSTDSMPKRCQGIAYLCVSCVVCCVLSVVCCVLMWGMQLPGRNRLRKHPVRKAAAVRLNELTC